MHKAHACVYTCHSQSSSGVSKEQWFPIGL